MKENMLATQKISKLAVKFIIPSVMGMLFMSLQTIIDGFFVGNFAGDTAMGALNIVMPVLNIAMALVMVVAVGGQSLMSIYLGAKNKKEAHNVFRTAAVGILAIGLILTLLGTLFAEPISIFLGADAEFLPYSSQYLRIITLFAIPFMLWFLCDFTLRIMGKVKLCMFAMIGGALLNMLLDFLFLYVFKMGIGGAALATGIAMSVSFVICLIPLFNRKNTLNVYHGVFKIKALFKMSLNGVSEGINAVASAIVVMLINLKLMQLVGNQGVTAYTAILYVTQIGFSLLAGLSDGLRPIISYNFGAKQTPRLKTLLRLNSILVIIAGLLLFCLLFFAGENLVSIFVSDPTVIAIGTNGARLFSFAFLFSGLNVFMSGYFTATNMALESGAVALMRGLVFIVIGIFTLPLFMGINGVWLCMPFSEILTLIIAGSMFLRYYKKGYLFDGKRNKADYSGGENADIEDIIE